MTTTAEQNTDTPRTEMARIDNSDFSDWGCGKSEYVHADFARILERELTAALTPAPDDCMKVLLDDERHNQLLQAEQELARLKAFNLAGYLKERRETIELSIAVEGSAGNSARMTCEQTALAEITALEIEIELAKARLTSAPAK